MAIKAEFVMSAMQPEQFPKERLPEIAMVGRSNVGKSSLINRLLGKPGLARTSNTPGRTQSLNFFRVKPDDIKRHEFFLVDMPGYGHAQVSQARRKSWGRLIEAYLADREMLCGIVHLIDMRHPPQPLDFQMSEWLRHYEHHFLVVGTKSDKIAKTKVPDHLLLIAEQLNIDSRDTLAFSAQTGLGRDELWRWIITTVEDARMQR
ncbi:MAG: putative GTP-binding protein EngB [bacterium ADurb.Bin429]|nr:MAG: putative GTP-binding protein EngB [bacterium ADurb.Bin429]